jgi:hypothetical protein
MTYDSSKFYFASLQIFAALAAHGKTCPDREGARGELFLSFIL